MKVWSIVIAILCSVSCGKPKSEGQGDSSSNVKQTVPSEKKTDAHIPNEHQHGRARFKDPMVYVDGKPIGALWFSEIPPTLKPHWKSETYTDGSQQKARRYRFADYLRSVGVPLGKVKELHVMGGAGFILRITGRELREYKGLLGFRFARETEGKPLLVAPPTYSANTTFDKVSSLMAYVDKKPPVINDRDVMIMDGKTFVGIPYQKEPIRGGIRVYLDDRIVTILKRRDFNETNAQVMNYKEGVPYWNLLKTLKLRGISSDEVALVEILHNERRGRRYSGERLRSLVFSVTPQTKGEVLIGDDKVPAHALALYSTPQPERTRPLRAD